ncbi:hypothetical protein [Spirillospora sp. NPDC047279]|uniref:MarR family winged helix-turn-helix transcriptional regulator n=1 Tax=Spirillospora sp. NPDC047279 TaxID=3155478 RepID=UPI0033D0FC3B
MKPLGYWLNRTDQALTAHMDRTLAEFGLTRVAWQMLNVIKSGADFSELQANADATTLGTTFDTLVADGWTTREPTLTPEGRARLTDVAERIATFRERSMAGISPDDYRTTIGVLERITANLDR